MPHSAQRAHTANMVGIWVFVLSDAVGFAALLTTMASLRFGGSQFAESAAPDLAMGMVATALLAVVSGCLVMAARKPRLARGLVALAALLASAFCALQYLEYQSLLGPELELSTPAQESFVVVTAYHLLHVFVGVLALSWGLSKKPVPMGPLSVYWHFVDGLWLFIFAFFYLL